MTPAIVEFSRHCRVSLNVPRRGDSAVGIMHPSRAARIALVTIDAMSSARAPMHLASNWEDAVPRSSSLRNALIGVRQQLYPARNELPPLSWLPPGVDMDILGACMVVAASQTARAHEIVMSSRLFLLPFMTKDPQAADEKLAAMRAYFRRLWNE